MLNQEQLNYSWKFHLYIVIWSSTVIVSLDNHSNVKISEKGNVEELWQMAEQNGSNVDF